MKVFTDPRIFAQLDELPEDERKKELNALVVLAERGVLPEAIGTEARRQLEEIIPAIKMKTINFITWKQFKEAVEAQGVKDWDVVDWIDYSGWPGDKPEVERTESENVTIK